MFEEEIATHTSNPGYGFSIQHRERVITDAPAPGKTSTPFMRTSSGRPISLLDPRVEDIFLPDIITQLTQQCRFNGCIRRFYSIAEHSVLVARLTPPEHKKWALFHDAAEAYLGDMISPIKHMPQMHVFRDLEARWMQVICQRFDLDPVEPAEVKTADRQALIIENLQLRAGTSSTLDDLADSVRESGIWTSHLGASPVIAEILFSAMVQEICPEVIEA